MQSNALVGRVAELGSLGRVAHRMDYRRIITIDPRVRNGQPCIRGLPIAVSDVLGWLASGLSAEQVVADHTDLTRDDILACLRFAVEHDPAA